MADPMEAMAKWRQYYCSRKQATLDAAPLKYRKHVLAERATKVKAATAQVLMVKTKFLKFLRNYCPRFQTNEILFEITGREKKKF
jgi:hypothetical protein